MYILTKIPQLFGAILLIPHLLYAQSVEQLEQSFKMDKFGSVVSQYVPSGVSSTEKYIKSNALYVVSCLESNKKKEAYQTLKLTEETLEKESIKLSALQQTYMDWAIGRYHLLYKENKIALPALKNVTNKAGSSPLYLIADTHNALGAYYYKQSDYPKALEHYYAFVGSYSKQKEQDIIYTKLGDSKLLVGELQEKLSQVPAAMQQYRELLENAPRLLDNKSDKIAELAFRLGRCYYSLQQQDSAFVYLNQAIGTQALLIDSKSNAELLLANIYAVQKKNKIALDYYGKAIADDGKAVPVESLQKFLSFGKQTQKSPDWSKDALAYYKTALEKPANWFYLNELAEFKEEPIKHPKANYSTAYNVALLSYQHAKKSLDKLPEADKKIAEIEILMSEGQLFFQGRDWKRAKTAYLSALKLMEPIYPAKHPMVAEAKRVLGEIYAEERVFTEALSYIDQALESSLKEGESLLSGKLPSFSQTNFPAELLYALGMKGTILAQSNLNADVSELEKALLVFERVLEILHQLQRTYREESAKYEINALGYRFCKQGLFVCLQLYKATSKPEYMHRAFYFAEQSRNGILMQCALGLQGKKIGGIPDSVTLRELQLRQQLGYLDSEIYYETKKGRYGDKNRIDSLLLVVEKTKQSYNTFLQTLEKKYPAYFQVKYSQKTATIKDLQQLLSSQEALLEYALLDSSSVCIFYITAQDIFLYEAKSKGNIPAQITAFLTAIKENKIENYLELANALSLCLLQPLAAQPYAQKHLMIVPDAQLFYIPFETLFTKAIEKNKWNYKMSELPLLLMQNSVSYQYSATWLQHQRGSSAERSQAPKSFLGISPDFATFDTSNIAFAQIAKRLRVTEMMPIPGAMEEVKNIYNQLGGDLFLGKDATEEAFKKNGQDYQILHLATHGLLDERKPTQSALVLLGTDTEDGLLHIYEIYNMVLGAELATLSACETGIGELSNGEGAISVGQAFSFAGCKSTAMSLWPANDQATKIIMESFYQYLQQGERKDVALQKAKVAYLEQTQGMSSYPFYWSVFVLVGESTSMDLKGMQDQRYFWWIVGGGIATLLSLLFLWVFKKYKNKKGVAAVVAFFVIAQPHTSAQLVCFKVLDAFSNEPQGGAKITVLYQDQGVQKNKWVTLQSAASDALGQFSFTLLPYTQFNQYQIQVTKENYFNQNFRIPPPQGKETMDTFSISFRPKNKYIIEGLLRNESTQDIIKKGKIVFTNLETQESKVVLVENGDYYFVATKEQDYAVEIQVEGFLVKHDTVSYQKLLESKQALAASVLEVNNSIDNEMALEMSLPMQLKPVIPIQTGKYKTSDVVELPNIAFNPHEPSLQQTWHESCSKNATYTFNPHEPSLQQTGEEAVKELCSILQERPQLVVKVLVYVYSEPSPRSNWLLAKKQAAKLIQQANDCGIDTKTRLECIPIGEEDTKQANSRKDRVEIVVVKGDLNE